MSQDPLKYIHADSHISVKLVVAFLNSIAIIMNGMIPVIYLVLRHHNQQAMDRTLIRQFVIIGIINFVRSILLLLLSMVKFTEVPCLILVSILYFTAMSTIILAFTVLLHLQLIVVHHVRKTRYIEPWYYVLAVVLGYIPTLMMQIINIPENRPIEILCEYDLNQLRQQYASFWYQFYVWVLLFVFLMLISLGVLVVWIIKEDRRIAQQISIHIQHPEQLGVHARNTASARTSNQVQVGHCWKVWRRRLFALVSATCLHILVLRHLRNSVVGRILLRLLWIPLTPLVCQGATIINSIISQANGDSPMLGLHIVSRVLVSLQAPCMALGFYQDITVQAALKKYRRDLLCKWYYEPLIIYHMERHSADEQLAMRQRAQGILTTIQRTGGPNMNGSAQRAVMVRMLETTGSDHQQNHIHFYNNDNNGDSAGRRLGTRHRWSSMSRSTLSESHAPILLPRPSQLAESASEEPPGSFQRPLWRNAASSPTEEELLPAFATIALPCQGHTAAQDTNTKPSSVPLKQVYSIARSRQHRLSHPPLRSFKARFMYYFCHYILASRSRKSGRDDDDDNRINTELPVGL